MKEVISLSRRPFYNQVKQRHPRTWPLTPDLLDVHGRPQDLPRPRRRKETTTRGTKCRDGIRAYVEKSGPLSGSGPCPCPCPPPAMTKRPVGTKSKKAVNNVTQDAPAEDPPIEAWGVGRLKLLLRRRRTGAQVRVPCAFLGLAGGRPTKQVPAQLRIASWPWPPLARDV